MSRPKSSKRNRIKNHIVIKKKKSEETYLIEMFLNGLQNVIEESEIIVDKLIFNYFQWGYAAQCFCFQLYSFPSCTTAAK